MDMFYLVLCFCGLFSNGIRGDVLNPVLHSVVLKGDHDTGSPREFPQKSDSSTPILVGNNPKSTNLPPKMFPTETSGQNSTGPPILSVTDAKTISDIKKTHEWLNMTALPNLNNTSGENPIEQEKVTGTTEQLPPEQFDMLHSKYRGGQDVDELYPERDEKKDQSKSEKKASEKDEKKQTIPKKDPKSEVQVSSDFDKNGPKSMNETKTKGGESLMESASKMMAVSSSVLSNAQGKHQGGMEPMKTMITLVLSLGFIVGVGMIGLLGWKRIAMRRHGRDVLINEDDFDEISDMHSFDRAQIKIT